MASNAARSGTTNGADGGRNVAIVATVPLGVVDDREDRHEVAEHRDHRHRRRGVRRLLHPRRERAEEPERRRVQQVAEDEPDRQQDDRAGRRRRQHETVRSRARRPSAAVMNTASWTIPRTPIPRTLPISRSRARTVDEDDLDDPALLLLDDAGQDREAEAEDADEDQDRPDVGDQELRLVLPRSAAWSDAASRAAAARRRAPPGRRCSRRGRPGRAARRSPRR